MQAVVRQFFITPFSFANKRRNIFESGNLEDSKLQIFFFNRCLNDCVCARPAVIALPHDAMQKWPWGEVAGSFLLEASTDSLLAYCVVLWLFSCNQEPCRELLRQPKKFFFILQPLSPRSLSVQHPVFLCEGQEYWMRCRVKDSFYPLAITLLDWETCTSHSAILLVGF